MDTFAHGIWTWIIFHTTNNIWLAVFFGMMPDLFSWTIYMFYSIITGEAKREFKKPDLNKIPNWAHVLYGLTHSIFVFTIVFIITWFIIGKTPIVLLAWLLHILIDIPTHSKEFLPTPFLWPISNWKFPGFSWGQKWFMILNYTLIIISLLIIFL